MGKKLLSFIVIASTLSSASAGIEHDFNEAKSFIKGLGNTAVNEANKLDIKDFPSSNHGLDSLYEQVQNESISLDEKAKEQTQKSQVEREIYNQGSADKYLNKKETQINDAANDIAKSYETESKSEETINKSQVYCANGTCSTQNHSTNDDFNQAASELSAIGGAAKEVNSTGDVTGRTRIFSGHVVTCKKLPVHFIDCCSDRGWGKALNLAHCPAEDRKLGVAKLEYKAHYIGEYCSKRKKWPGGSVCKERRRTYCVFNSKLARIIREQAPYTTGSPWKGFGSAQYPDCSGYLPQEFEKVTLSEINFENPLYPFNPNAPFGKANDNKAGVAVDLSRAMVDEQRLKQRAKETSENSHQGKPEGGHS